VCAKERPLTSAVAPLGGRPGVEGGKLSFIVLYGTLGEKVERPGRALRVDPRKRLRGVVAVPEKSVAGRVVDVEKVEVEMVLNLLGLSPGILIRVVDGFEALVLVESEEKFVLFGVLDDCMSEALTEYESLLDGLAGRSMILREDS
jgi:hypothetical protein